MCPASFCKSAIRVLKDKQVESNVMLQQPTCTRMLGTPLAKNKTKLQMRRHQMKLLGHNTSSLRELCLRACLWTHGQLPSVASTDNKAANKLCMQHTCKKSNKNGNKTRIPRHANPSITKRRCSFSCKIEQDNG